MSRIRRRGRAELGRRLARIVERTATSHHVHSLLLGVETDDGAVSVRMAAGAATTSDRYIIASVSKMFTASIVLQLCDERRLRLDDRVVGLLPHLDLAGLHRSGGVDQTGDLELHHLLHQTSGLADYYAGGLETDLIENRDRGYTIDDVVDMARMAGPLFPPGDRHDTRSSYSDTNYQLLTAVIEAVTGATYGQAVEERIVGPLGLSDTVLAGLEPGPGPAPLPLHHRDRELDVPQALASERGAGGIISTLDDQVRFLRAYHGCRLFDPSHIDTMHRWNRIFFPVDYGFGVMRFRLPRWMTGLRPVPELIGHSGSTNSFAFTAPELRCHIVGTLNQLDDPARSFRLMARVADAVRRAR